MDEIMKGKRADGKRVTETKSKGLRRVQGETKSDGEQVFDPRAISAIVGIT